MNYSKRQEYLPDGTLTLASFRRRLLALIIDLSLIAVIILLLTVIVSKLLGLETAQFIWNDLEEYELEAEGINRSLMHAINLCMGFLPLVYFFISVFISNGRTIGKKITAIKIVGIYHHKLNLWHCLERSLGYVASAAEMGLGFFQVLWNPNRMALHDKIAETIVIKCSRKK